MAKSKTVVLMLAVEEQTDPQLLLQSIGEGLDSVLSGVILKDEGNGLTADLATAMRFVE